MKTSVDQNGDEPPVRLKPLPGIVGRPAVPAGSTLTDASETIAELPAEVGAAIAEYLRLLERAEHVDRDAFLARHAGVAGELVEFFENADRLHMLAARDTVRTNDSRPPANVDHFRIVREVDRGGMGVVYEARSSESGMTVALKMILALSPSAEYIERFQREARIAAALQHPGIVRIHDTGQHEGRPYFTMDYVEGSNLAKFVRGRPFGPRRTAKCVRRIADAVEYAHSQGVLHRDLKPHNILIDKAGRLRITDFGLARLTETNVRATSTGQVLGSPAYMSPEQAAGDSDSIGPQSDVYSLGVILYELLVGRPPFVAATVLETLRQVVEVEPEAPRSLNSAVDRDLETICLICLRKDPSQRYQSARELAEDLARYLQGRPIRAKLPSATRSSTLLGRTATACMVAAGVIVLTPLSLYHGVHRSTGETAQSIHSGMLMIAETPQVAIDPSQPVVRSEDDPNAGVFEVGHPRPRPDATSDAAVLLGEIEEAKALSGKPFGVGRILFRIPADAQFALGWDEVAYVSSQDGRILYSSVESRPNDDGTTFLEALFLFSGEPGLTVDVVAGERRVATSLSLDVTAAPAEHAPLLSRWWESFGRTAPEGGSATTRAVKNYLMRMLSRRLQFPELPALAASDERTKVEKEFERTVSMLFGFESVRLAMMTDDVTLGEEIDRVSTHPLPEPLAIPPVVVPDVAENVYIEPIAKVIPQQCYYVRFGRMRNYLSFREMIMGWGGSLGDVVAMTSLERDLRARYETQLALTLDHPFAESLDAEIRDVALIGTDLCFDTGAGLGVVFEEMPAQRRRLAELLTAARQANGKAGAATESKLDIDGHVVSLLESDDQTVRSYYVAVGRFHLVTNSQYIVTRFLASADGRNSIGSLPEFAYARSQLSDDVGYSALLYVPDAFFRNITSPQFRVEAGRREVAAEELADAKMASAFARDEGKPHATVDELIRGGFLAHDFGRRPDRSRPMRRRSGLVDSRRGAAGCFLPVLDVGVTTATRGEIESYNRFRSAYRREWGLMDPVSVAFSRGASADPWSANVVLDIAITPYARNEYGFLRNHLALPQRRHVPVPESDVMGLSACLAGNHSFLNAYVGLRDQAVPFEIVAGEIVRLDGWMNSDFADRNWYAAVSPQGLDGLQLLRNFVASVQQRAEVLPDETTPPLELGEVGWTALAAVALPFNSHGIVGRAIVGSYWCPNAPGYVLSKLNDSGLLSQIGTIRIGPTSWTLMSPTPEVRAAAIEDLAFENETRPAQVVFRLGDVADSDVYPYVRASSYCDARTVAAGDAHLLDWIGCQLDLEPAAARRQLEDVLAARFVSPIGGHYVLAPTPTGPRWRGSLWGAARLQEENSVPHDYRVRFLEWLRGLKIEFSLDGTTLRSRVECEIERPKIDADLHPLLKNPAVRF